jgi:hypothetical protein
MASFAEIRAQLANLNKRTSKNTDIWKPKDEHDVRCLRNPHSDDPLEQITFHYNVGDAREVLCPQQFGDECVICDFAETLKGWKDAEGNDKPEAERKAQWEIFKKIQAVTKVYVPMVERLEGGAITEPAWWGLTSNQSQMALKVCGDKERLAACGVDPNDDEHALDALFSPKKAFDLHVSFKKPGEKQNSKTFTVVEIEPKYSPSPLTGNAGKDAELVKKIKPIREVFPKVPTSEVELALKKFIGGGQKVETKPAEKEQKYAGKGTEKAAKAGTRSVDDAFGDLLNDSK